MHEHIHSDCDIPVRFTESINTSLELLRAIEQTVDMLASDERLLEEVTHALQKVTEEIEALEVKLPEMDKHIDQFERSAEFLANHVKILFTKRGATIESPHLTGENQELIVMAYDRAIEGIKRTLEASECMKWALMENQADHDETIGTADTVEELVEQLNS